MPSYIPHPSLAGLQAGNDLGLAALRSLDNQTTNFTNNFALAQRERERQLMDTLRAQDNLRAGLNPAGTGGFTGGPLLATNMYDRIIGALGQSQYGMMGLSPSGQQVRRNMMPIDTIPVPMANNYQAYGKPTGAFDFMKILSGGGLFKP